MSLSVDTLLFDLDGTLVEPTIDFGLLKQRVLDVCRAAGVAPERWRHLPALEIVASAAAELRELSVERANDLAITANEAIMTVETEAAGRARPYVGVPEMLGALIGAGYRVGVVTRNSRAATEIMLKRWALPMQALITRDDVGRVKPDPEHLLAALRALGADGSRVLMCGDHPMDVAAGKSIGAYTAAVCTEEIPRESLSAAGPDLILEHVTDLVGHLDRRM